MRVNAFLSWCSDVMTALLKYNFFMFLVIFFMAIKSDLLSHIMLADELHSVILEAKAQSRVVGSYS